MLFGFERLNIRQQISSEEGGTSDHEGAGPEELDVVYKAPCGLRLRNHDDVMHFLLATDSSDILQVSWIIVMCSGLRDVLRYEKVSEALLYRLLLPHDRLHVTFV